MIKIWGITGPIGSGKSQLLGLLKNLGFEGLDADQCVSGLWSHPPDSLRHQLLKEFGSADKTSIRQRVANDPERRARLESILHPFVYQELARWLGSVRGSVVFVEGTRWSQGASLQGWQGVLFVDAPEAIRLQRVRSRNPETADLLWSLSARLPWDELRQTSDSCLINDSDLPNLRAQVEQWLKEKGIKIPQART